MASDSITTLGLILLGILLAILSFIVIWYLPSFSRKVGKANADSDSQTLNNSSRRVSKATLVSLQLDSPPATNVGGAVPKLALVNQLRLQLGEVSAARSLMCSAENAPRLLASEGEDPQVRALSIDGSTNQLWENLQAFEGSPISSQLPVPSAFANVPVPTLQAFGEAIVAVRQQALDQLNQQQTETTQGVLVRSSPVSEIAAALNLLNAATVATKTFENNIKVTPIGYLHLERIEMKPVGVERGELIATIPLAPLEKTAVVHKEWSVTNKEFTSIVTDSLENYSETGVTENTELAQSSTAQATHNNQFNVNGTVTGNYGIVTPISANVSATVSTGFITQDQNSTSTSESRKHAIATTRKASTRVKQEHKVTISTTTVTGTSETSTRMIENPSRTNPIRIDYFSIMRKWHVGLYRYGLRLTYDIAIPQPGAAMRKIYAAIDELQKQMKPFDFPVTHAEITLDNYLDLANRYDAQVPLPPPSRSPIRVSQTPPVGEGWNLVSLGFGVEAGYQISKVHIFADLKRFDTDHEVPALIVEGTAPIVSFNQGSPNPPVVVVQPGTDIVAIHVDDAKIPGFLEGAMGSQNVTFNIFEAEKAFIGLTVDIEPTEEAKQRWKNDVWNALYNAAQTKYYTEQQEIQGKITALEEKIFNVDTLTLRREENEEIMKCVLRWLLGPNFDFMPKDVVDQFADPNSNIDIFHGTVIDATKGDGLKVTATGWQPMFLYQEMVKFINQAIEWENVLYFLYSYFWDVQPSWDFIRQIRHPDSTRQAFLRAGSARVVLTVRQGWEQAWVKFVEAGKIGLPSNQVPLPSDHPYLSIATEVQLYNQTNYPGIPPANPGGGPLPDSGAYAASESSEKLTSSAGKPVTIAVKSSAGFIVGYTAIIDTWDTKIVKDGKTVTAQETQIILAVPDATHITVERIENPHDGSQKPFPIMQGGEKGQLIAEWFEYTPTSGTDIAVTSNLATIA
ncbi:hypothetical protein [Leptolyngbya sp. NK1-12]|uniref:hypothetical protein n=1 Tax=Leptolyngbya sp. NK1-12 TaxID=2547451 RepID=UPI0029319BD2|nr:hypothetical protein [Leptolyngbya sp. NK1-12]